APTRRALADAPGPDLVPGQVKSKDAGPAEKDEETPAVAGGRAGSVAVLAVVAGAVGRLGQLGLDVLAPAEGARLAVEADQVAHQVLLIAGVVRRLGVAAVAGEVNRVADRDRARAARPRQPGLPGDVLRFRPRLGKSLVVADALTARPPELHPVRGKRGG